MSMITNLRFEQLMFLRILRDNKDIEGSEACKKADCGFVEFYLLESRGLVDCGAGRIMPNRLHPILTNDGIVAIEEAIEKEIIQT